MQHKENNKEHFEGKNILQSEKYFIQGHIDAIEFARNCKGVVARIQLKIGEVKDKMTNSLNEVTNDDLPKLYFKGFITGLENTLDIIEASHKDPKMFQPSEIYPTKVEFDLAWASLPISGRLQAFNFALECLGDLENLKTEVNETKTLISSSENPAYKQSSSPGRFQRGYLNGLKDVIKIIST